MKSDYLPRNSDSAQPPDSKAQQALDYVASRLRVLPLHNPTPTGCSCGRNQCTSEGKHPRTSHGVKDATSDLDQIRRWWERWPDANIGIATGRGVVVLDLDGQVGRDWLEQNSERMPDTLKVVTGNGIHLYFTVPEGETLGNRKIVGGEGGEVLLKGNGGYVVAPPSDHPSGMTYELEDHDVEVAELPGWILESKKTVGKIEVGDDLVRDPKAAPPVDKIGELMTDPVFAKTWAHKRNDELSDSSMSGYDMSIASQAAAAGWSDQEIADLIIAHRREKGNRSDLAKAMEHPTYLEHTVARALRRESSPPNGGGNVEQIIHGMTQRGKQEPQYDLHLSDGSTVTLKSTMDLMAYKKVKAAVYEVESELQLPTMKPREWIDVVCGYLRDIREIIPTLTAEEQTEHWVLDALDTSMDPGPHDMAPGSEERVFILDLVGGGGVYAFTNTEGCAYLHLQSFRRFLWARINEKLPEKSVAERLSRIGFERKHLQWKSSDGGTKRIRLWVSTHPVNRNAHPNDGSVFASRACGK